MAYGSFNTVLLYFSPAADAYFAYFIQRSTQFFLEFLLFYLHLKCYTSLYSQHKKYGIYKR